MGWTAPFMIVDIFPSPLTIVTTLSLSLYSTTTNKHLGALGSVVSAVFNIIVLQQHVNLSRASSSRSRGHR